MYASCQLQLEAQANVIKLTMTLIAIIAKVLGKDFSLDALPAGFPLGKPFLSANLALSFAC